MLSDASTNAKCRMFQHPPEEDQYGYEDAGERWLPVHSVESIVRKLTWSKTSSELTVLYSASFSHLPSFLG